LIFYNRPSFELEPLGERSHNAWVTLIDVLLEHRLALVIDPNRPVKQKNGHRLGQRHGHGLPGINGLQYILLIPLDIVIQQQGREFVGVLDTDAAGTKGGPGSWRSI
jgi:hypothetical protein